MAKKKVNPEHYEYIRCHVDGDGGLEWIYKLNGGQPSGMAHDEDVSGWSDRDIVSVTKSMLCVEDDDPVKIEVIHV